MATSNYYLMDFFQSLERWGLTDIMLPFLLVFVLVFAVLEKTAVLGADKKNFNVIVALVLALATIIPHATSTYPCEPGELNLRMINTLQSEFSCPIGYSGHEVGLIPTVTAVALGACVVERHITLDRAMWGSDQAASVERLVKYIRVTEESLGDGVKRVYESERPSLQKLRRIFH